MKDNYGASRNSGNSILSERLKIDNEDKSLPPKFTPTFELLSLTGSKILFHK